MAAYVDEVRKLEKHFDSLELHHVPHRDNMLTDELSRLTSSHASILAGTFEERLTPPSFSAAYQDEGEAPRQGEVAQVTPSVEKPVKESLSDECPVLAGSSQEPPWIDCI
ncbi:hypothetical protein E2562_033732 [Oryza meyeriana var. granulata]|uniref:RNase H type-1 domain-containing protein n=1 Tax=Oryza meyeriana var. granulata TaxID=110450 RepID=A0A6G1CAW5_9ORYZ|nr:hypothetical protein E2562_033732 [Oryza meyeriana var. granulata]